MSTKSFADLGASRPVVEALAEPAGSPTPFPVQRLVLPDALAGRDVLVKSPTGSGKTLAFAVPLVERIEAGDPPPERASCSRRRASSPGRSSTQMRPLAHARALSVAAVYGGAGIERQTKLARRAHILVATPGRLEDLIERARRRPRPRDDARPRRGRPDARHGLPPAGRPHRRLDPAQAPDPLLLGHAARRGRPDRPRVHPRRRAATSTPTRRSGAATVDHRFVPVTPRRQARRARARAARPGPRPDARLRPHQARRRPARQAPARAGHRGARDARQQDPVPAREGAGPLRRAATSTPSWRPTWPPAASTSTTSPT